MREMAALAPLRTFELFVSLPPKESWLFTEPSLLIPPAP